jgi:sugar phosphate permease
MTGHGTRPRCGHVRVDGKNLAQGFVGTVSGVGASLSTTLSGLIAGNLGLTTAFVAITAIALIALLVVWGLMPETKPKA